MSPTPASHWLGFHVALLLLLAVELVFSRWGLARLPAEARPARQQRNAVVATCMWVAAALAFAVFVWHTLGTVSSSQFLAGYAIEEALSIDNLFVFLLLFRVFAIPAVFQPRALFWGVLGAILLRGLFIAAGVQLILRFEWISYVFAAILLVAAIRLVLPSEKKEAPGNLAAQPPFWVRWISKIHPVSPRHDVFFCVQEGHRRITMLFLALLAIEAADILFALDSIPAVLSITHQPFLAYTSNILAVMGLRSLYFLLVHMLRKLRFLHFGLAAILAFAAIRMLAARWVEVGPLTSLAIILGILGITVAVSLLHPTQESPT
jgi:tellurite resistance protein TerC